ncbi:hypothetical protein O9H85_08080 [Paenibacillus filicis]|uniref:Uncharacterized protein n=1 Tax=Paenibacillus gyeongsangnamensis TaxID=3388067 RepID=A0ABT4Q690_9BACL|nr:hypothetical protein [Paenibacillus filicis]MCZ8512390.1 hypothetical protein [Paenibacillus filicis]
MVQQIINQYWGIVSVFLFGVVYVITHYQASIAFAKKKAITLMLAVEKKAEQLALDNGQDKFNWVCDKGYDLLPSVVRLVVSKPLFKTIVQSLFDEAIAFAKQHQIEKQNIDIPV